ncbi:branched-chain alpha-keto acid dehydrogenase subunit E2 [Suicoccus acidiformans]|uniref:Dihydrolipoamide acetyltransferase component of pyruvate dehydrogenase complex n=1 Tax=Suicoccus acidiformans TaxID=2036206 RepID=A0A347WJZ1_9LACT|nr:dihydrolipoamide acetyltransferase family protein [Suicoccus acidiformans]AXY25398.1 branched-chain alpha-keto acid dehydrogenase subunit E2 [Suicoccus acidiformans]
MATKIVMPTLGLTMTEGTIDEWLVSEGDSVSKGDPVASISSEKLSADVEAPEDGVVLKIVADEGDTVPIKEAMAYIGEEGETIDVSNDVKDKTENKQQTEVQAPEKQVTKKEVAEDYESKEGGRIFITPLARKMAAEKGYDISKINGTGGNGRITRRDIERYVPEQDAIESKAVSVESEEIGAGLTGMRKTIAQRMVRSLQTTAQVTIHAKADVTSLMAFRKDMKAKVNVPLDRGQLSINTLITRATILALKETPEMNGWYANGSYEQIEEIHIGQAVSVDDGLVVPVVKYAGKMNLTELGSALSDVATQARQGTLSGDLYGGSTFTITNLGHSGIEYFTPIINSPEIGILGVGAIQSELGFDENKEVVELVKLGLSLTFDHQIIDGSEAADFLALIISFLEDPYRLVL